MTNFLRLKKLINETMSQPEKEQTRFWQRLHDIAEAEMTLKQASLSSYFS